MGKRASAIVGFTEWNPQRRWPKPMFALDAMAQLAAEALADARFGKDEFDGIVISHVPEAPYFAPSAVAEHLGITASFAEFVDLGGASAAGMVWRAAAAIEVGACETVLVLCPGVPAPRDPAAAPDQLSALVYMGGNAWGSPQAQFEIPAGLVAAVASYALAAKRYDAQHGLDPTVLAKIAVHQRDNALANPNAVFFDKPITIEDVLASRVVADPIKLLEVVMPCAGGAALLVTSAARARRAPRRPVFVAGYGESLTHRSITNMPDLLSPPLADAARRAFAMAATSPGAIDLFCPYDSFTITVLLSVEAAGFCRPGHGQDFIRERDLRYSGDWPVNTHGGQLSFGQPGLAGGLSHFVEAVRQIQGVAGERQLRRCDRALCTGSGGMLSEQSAVVLEGA